MGQRASLSQASLASCSFAWWWLVAEATQSNITTPLNPLLWLIPSRGGGANGGGSCDHGPTLSPRRLGRYLLYGGRACRKEGRNDPTGQQSRDRRRLSAPVLGGSWCGQDGEGCSLEPVQQGNEGPSPKAGCAQNPGAEWRRPSSLCSLPMAESRADTSEGTLAWRQLCQVTWSLHSRLLVTRFLGTSRSPATLSVSWTRSLVSLAHPRQ